MIYRVRYLLLRKYTRRGFIEPFSFQRLSYRSPKLLYIYIEDITIFITQISQLIRTRYLDLYLYSTRINGGEMSINFPNIKQTKMNDPMFVEIIFNQQVMMMIIIIITFLSCILQNYWNTSTYLKCAPSLSHLSSRFCIFWNVLKLLKFYCLR